MMNIIFWIIFGALGGWITAIIADTDNSQAAMRNIFVGITGALLGGLLMRSLGGQDINGFSVSSFFVALLGAMTLLSLVTVINKRRI